MSSLGDAGEEIGKGLGSLLGFALSVMGIAWVCGHVVGFVRDVFVVVLWIGAGAIGLGLIGLLVFVGFWAYEEIRLLYGPLRCKNCGRRSGSPRSSCLHCGAAMRGFKFQCASCGTIWSSYHADCPDCGALMDEQ